MYFPLHDILSECIKYLVFSHFVFCIKVVSVSQMCYIQVLSLGSFIRNFLVTLSFKVLPVLMTIAQIDYFSDHMWNIAKK